MTRAFLIALPLAVLGAAMASYSDLYHFKKLGSYQLPPGAIALFATMLATNMLVRRLAPTRALNRRELLLIYAVVAIAVLFEVRGSILPALLHGMKLADVTKASAHRYLGGMLAVLPFAMMAAYAVHLLVFYRHGALQCLDVWSARAQAGVGFDNLARRLGAPAGVEWSRVGWMGTGLFSLVALQGLRRWLLWFPVNPVGMVMAVSYPSVTLWASMTAGGTLKLVMLRYGGKRLHDAGKDIAIGWVLGHVAVTLFWYGFDFLTGTSARPLGLE